MTGGVGLVITEACAVDHCSCSYGTDQLGGTTAVERAAYVVSVIEAVRAAVGSPDG